MSEIKRIPDYTKHSDKSKCRKEDIQWLSNDTKMCFTRENIQINNNKYNATKTTSKSKTEILYSNNLTPAELHHISNIKNNP